MKTAPISAIEIPERQRKAHAPAHIRDLKAAILSKGFLSPILLSEVLNEDGTVTGWKLVAGCGRLTAVTELAAVNTEIAFERELLPLGHIPYITIGDLSPADVAEAELQENILRANLTFMEEAEARALIHKLRLEQNVSQTLTATATEIAARSGKSENAENIALSRSLLVVENKTNPRVSKAKTLSQAYQAVLDMNSSKLQAELLKRGLVKHDHEIHLGDCREILSKFPDGMCDTILCDPPYGINADEMKKDAGHHYDDSPTYALEISKFILKEGFRLLKPRGNIFIFCDIDHFLELREYAKAQAYSIWRTPIVWAKGAEGFAPHGKLGFVRTYELFAFFTKGRKGLKSGGPDVKVFQRPSRSERGHAAEKPAPLLSHLLAIAGDAGDVVLDPCCGSGSIIEAAVAQKMKAICVEKDPTYHTLALSRLATLLEPKPQIEETTEAELLI